MSQVSSASFDSWNQGVQVGQSYGSINTEFQAQSGKVQVAPAQGSSANIAWKDVL
jgi:hypothetical protein